jgi:homoserine kinase type II
MEISAHFRALLEQWPIGAIEQLEPIESGTINRCFAITSAAGRFVLRQYRTQDRSLIERELLLIERVGAAGLPSLPAIATHEGEAIVCFEGSYYTLFPWAQGQQLSAGSISAAHDCELGRFLAQVHRVLHDYPLEQLKQRSFQIDAEVGLATSARLIALLETQPTLVQQERDLLQCLQTQRAWMERSLGELDSSVAFERLPKQAVHGDYTYANLFFEGERVSAVIDWEQAYGAPTVWELVRVIDLVLECDPKRTKQFLQGYGEYDRAQLRLAVAHYSLLRIFDTWMPKAILEEENTRLYRFVKPDFVPFSQRWQAIEDDLGIEKGMLQ